MFYWCHKLFYPCVAGDVRRPQKALQTQSFRNPCTEKVIYNTGPLFKCSKAILLISERSRLSHFCYIYSVDTLAGFSKCTQYSLWNPQKHSKQINMKAPALHYAPMSNSEHPLPQEKNWRRISETLFIRLKNAVLDGHRRAAFCTVSLLQIQFPSFKFSTLVDVEGKHI